MAGPRYSIVLPTRNGARLLDTCIRSVLSQSSDDFELVVSDNASTDETATILAEHADDPRIRLLRQGTPLGVTESWNAAMAACTGERVTLIGDDEALLPGYFERADALLELHGNPDVLQYNAFSFAYPGVATHTIGHYREALFEPGPSLPANGEYPLELRRRLIADLLRFDFRASLHMQTVLVARHALERLPADPFQPPFPDVYAVAGLLLTAETWAVSSERLMVVGIAPKAYEHTVFSDDSEEQVGGYLGIDPRFPDILPGAMLWNGNYETFLALKRDYPAELAGVEIDRHAYVLQQVYYWYCERRVGSLSTRELMRRLRLLRARDWLGLPRVVGERLHPGVLRERLALKHKSSADVLWPGLRPLPGVSTVDEFLAWIEEGQPHPIADG